MILTRSDEIATATDLVGVVASSTAAKQDPRPNYYIEIPYHPSGRVCTKLKQPTVAVCNWSVTVIKNEIDEANIGGHVPPTIMELIVNKYLECHQQEPEI